MRESKPILSTPASRWFRFSLRGPLLCILVLGGLFAGLGKPVFRSGIERSVIREITDAGGVVHCNYQLKDGQLDPDQIPPGPSHLRSILGDDTFASVGTVYLYSGFPPMPECGEHNVSDLQRLTDLYRVKLSGEKFTDNCIDDLLRIKKLRSLSLLKTSISANGLRRLAESKTILHLTLSGFGNDKIQLLERLPGKRRFRKAVTKITDDWIASLGSLSNLRTLHILNAPEVTDAGLQALEKFSHLEELELLETGLTDQSLQTISRLQELKRLYLRDHPISDEGIVHLQALSHLEYLDIRSTKITEAGIEALGSITSLQELHVGPPGRFSAQSTADLSDQLPQCNIYLWSSPSAIGSSRVHLVRGHFPKPERIR